MNLITNASEAIGNDPGEILIKTAVQSLSAEELSVLSKDYSLEQGDYLVITVKDSGRGMDDKIRMRIFDPFFTTKTSGRGLGLAAVQGIVQAHRGAITLETALDKGSTFSVYLPYQPLRAFTPTVTTEKEILPSKATVLVVDDEVQVRQVFCGNADQHRL